MSTETANTAGSTITPETQITIEPGAAGLKHAAVVPAPAPTGEPNEKPSWLDARLAREKAQVLKDLGIDSIETGKTAIAEAKAAADAKKTDAQKAADAAKALETTTSELARANAAVGEYAKSIMTGLTEAQQAAVMAVAGEDAALQIKTVNALRPTWASAQAAAPAAVPVVANTAVTKAAPKDEGNPGGAPDPKALYEANKDKNPFFWARFAEKHGLFTSA